MVSWDQHVPFGGLKWVPQDQNGSLKRPKTGLEEDVVGSFWVMWAFLLAQLLKNWSINFFEKVTLLNLMPSTSPNWGGIPRWPPAPSPQPQPHSVHLENSAPAVVRQQFSRRTDI